MTRLRGKFLLAGACFLDEPTFLGANFSLFHNSTCNTQGAKKIYCFSLTLLDSSIHNLIYNKTDSRSSSMIDSIVVVNVVARSSNHRRSIIEISAPVIALSFSIIALGNPFPDFFFCFLSDRHQWCDYVFVLVSPVAQ